MSAISNNLNLSTLINIILVRVLLKFASDSNIVNYIGDIYVSE